MALAGALAVGLAVLLGWRDMRRVPRVVFSVAGLALVFALGRDAALVSEAAGNMTRLAGLVLSVMLLSSVLGRSRDLQRISASLFGGRPGSRYLSLAFGHRPGVHSPELWCRGGGWQPGVRASAS